ncbi:MAG TPA: hypothetical protein VK053_09115, partial [Jiangellaceae bacterium]|nr:hypothetical protein [Jiangellaceae bacterium]
LRDWRDMVADAVTSFGGLVDGYNAAAEAADEGVVSLGAWIEALEDQAEAAANWRENVLTATEQIKEQVPADMQAAAHAMVDEFIAAGPEGAAALALFTEASAEEKLRILEAWQGTGYELAGTFAEEVESARKPEVGASTVPAEEALGALLGAIAASEEEVVIDGHAVPADEVLSALRHRIAMTNEDVTIDGNEAPALDVLNALVLAIANEEEDVTINGNRVPADQVVGELMRWIGDQNEAVDVHANTAPATEDVRNWSPPNKTIAMGADLTAARREVLSWRPSVQIAMYGQAAMASGGYVGDFARAARFASGGFARRFDAGGSVFGPGTGTSDSIPAWLSNGEFVQKAAAVQKYGLAFMHAVNQGRYPTQLARGYADGGYASQRFTPSVQYVPRVAPAGGGRGLRIRGRLDLGNGLEGFIDGRIDERDWLEAYS